jgi:monooxygenase
VAEHVDVIIVGAGLSGIGQARHLQRDCPDRSFLILESREAIGGTWDLFRYPGVRSDSDMHTLGYSFRPWTGGASFADGTSIRTYIADAAREGGLDALIRFGVHVEAAAWSTDDTRWTVTARRADGERITFTCGWLCMCSGYYNYARGHAPDFPGAEEFGGLIVHPQFWPADLDYGGKRVVVIGSGATAVTLVPAMAKQATSVTMLQRSPTYVVALPGEDRVGQWLGRWLPKAAARRLTRWKNILLSMIFYRLARARPEAIKRRMIKGVRDQLGAGYDVETHFTPRYAPWDQRVCVVPDADLFAAIKEGRAEVVTDTVERFTMSGLRLGSGRELQADVVVTATGLEIQLLGDVQFTLDGAPIELSRSVQYKGLMFSDVPNLSFTFGYTNASWTLKADLVARYVCRLLNTMRRRGVRQATPHLGDPEMERLPAVDFSSGYIQRAQGKLPQQGAKRPWRLHQNYALDLATLRFGSVDNEMVFFESGRERPRAARRGGARGDECIKEQG